jgi:hypothetical protein
MKEEISHILSEMKEKINIFVYLFERKKDCVYLKGKHGEEWRA